MTAIEWLELACNKLGAPVMSYAPEVAMKEYEQRIQEVTRILHEVLVLLKDPPKPTCEHEWEPSVANTFGDILQYSCQKCKIEKSQPKPEQIELLEIIPACHFKATASVRDLDEFEVLKLVVVNINKLPIAAQERIVRYLSNRYLNRAGSGLE